MHTTEMRMLRWERGKTRLDHVRNVDIMEGGTYVGLHDGRIPQREEVEMFEHVQRRDKYDATRKILQMTLDGLRNRGKPKLRWRDLVKKDMTRNQMTND